jgi:hypothetical protein
MLKRNIFLVFFLAFILGMPFVFAPRAFAQQTLGGITGTIVDTTGSVLPGASVTIVGDQTQLTRSQKSNDNGSYDFVNLPIGTYTLTFTHDGFETQRMPSIQVQANRTATLNVTLKVGQVGTTITVAASPLMNAVDTTNGYILEKDQIDAIPLPTGSFTGLAILSPGVNAELPGGTGVNSGLGNQPIWANGQRDTSNSFLLNGVDDSNLFNGKSTSQVASARVVNNTGVANPNSTTAAPVQSTASVYLAIGQALPTPAPETIQEVRVNTSMYDAQQGATSGAHIDMSTTSGTNAIHGQTYVHRGTNWLNAAPFFDKQDPNIPADDKNPELHRYTAGGTLGGPIIKDKLFGFVSYQHVHASDQDIGLSRLIVPPGLTNDRSVTALETISDTNWGTNLLQTGGVDPIAVALFQYKLPNGQYLIPSWDGQTATATFPENAISPGTAYFISDQVVTNLDWNASSKDTVSAKYYYQHDPSIAPYAYSSIPGFTQHLDAGSQVASITNSQSITPNFSVTEVLGILREKAYSTIGQPFTPQSFAAQTGTMPINTFGSPYFPGISIVDPFGLDGPANTGIGPTCNAANPCPITNQQPLVIGGGSASQGAFTGVFQNRIMPSANAIWLHGKHTLTFGGSYAYTQLNARDERTNQGIISSADFSQFIQGFVDTNDDFTTTKFLQGNANRYFRAGQSGAYFQDKFQFRSNLSLTAGLRWDWDGGLTEKYGRIFNFDPSRYTYDDTTDTIDPSGTGMNGMIIAGNNKLFPTKGVSNTTLTGRQWGFAPRLGIAWSPKHFNDKVVVRAGTGIYYDRGELYSYLSPGFAEGVINGGPFGVNQTPPFVNAQTCPGASSNLYLGYIPTCPAPYTLANPWGSTLGPPPSGNPADIDQYLPNESAIVNGAQLFSFATYDRANKLPYTINDTLDIQWQPRSDLAIEVGYVGNLGRHEVIPVPFNQPGIASPSHIIHPNSLYPQQYTYGYTVTDSSGNPIQLPNGQGPYLINYEGGNVDLRVPYIGYSAESDDFKAAGVSAYNALQTHVEKRMSHGLQVGFSYTYSHSLDEQSGLGLFFNGNNPQNLRSAYGSSDFDRTHVFNFSYSYQLPKFYSLSTLKGKVADGWSIQGITVIQSGQPYSIVDYTGAVGSIYFSVYNGLTNPIVPLAPGCTAKNAVTGASGAFGNGDVALKASCFTVPLLSPGALGGAIPAGDTFETDFTNGQRNIFRQSWQRRADISFVKLTQLTERFSLKYSFDVFNLTNTASFDIPVDDVSQNEFYNQFPVQGTPPLPANCGNVPFCSFYNPPSGLGNTNKTIGSPRQIQMSLNLSF